MDVPSLDVIVLHPTLNRMKYVQLLHDKCVPGDQVFQTVLRELEYRVAVYDHFCIIVDKVGTVLVQLGGTVEISIEVELQCIAEVGDGRQLVFKLALQLGKVVFV